MSYATITTEGGLLPADLLDQIAAGELPGQQPRDFGLPATSRLSDEIAAAWGEARAYWNATQQSLARLRPDESTTRPARRWITALLEALGYHELTFMPIAARVESRTYAISHRAGRDESAPPVHIEGFGVDLDRRAPGGRPRLSPHALVQEYLNSTEHLWGIVTNGERLRLLRDSAQIARPRYVEFDLRGMFEGEKFNEFALMYRLLHRSRLPQSDADAATCLLEQYHQQAIQSGGRVRERLREGVELALKTLGNGLLQHPYNAALRQKLQSGQLGALDYYRQLLRLVYRLLFLMVAEERGLIAVSDDIDDPFSPLHYRAPRDERLRIYLDYYSVTRLRRLAEAPGAGRAPYDDLWLGLLTTFRLLEGSDEQGARLLGLTPLNGDLFGEHAIRDLLDTRLRNDALLKAIHALSLYRDPQSRIQRRVNYAALDVEELGSVYESLLDYRPVVTGIAPRRHGDTEHPKETPRLRVSVVSSMNFDLVAGTERKTTGSYYTHPSLVQELIRSALEPVIADRLRGIAASVAPQPHGGTEDPNDSVVQQKEAALLSIKVCDPACGSGHFLLAAARRLGRELARIRSGEDQPTPGAYRQAVRDVIAHCIYGVDLNPLAVDLCKLALWIEGHNAGLPLSFLDHHIKWGNSLVGATAALVQQGIPDDAYKPVTGDDKATAAAIRKRNKAEREAWLTHRAVQETLFASEEHADTRARLAQALHDLETQPDATVADIRAKAQRYAELQALADAERTRYHLWTAAFFQPLTAEHAELVPTTGTLIEHERRPKPLDDPRVAAAYALASEVGFFHWELEFPLVFRDSPPQASDAPRRHGGTEDSKGGFDVVLGNPPWERIKLQEEEFFAAYDRQIANAPNKAARQRLIDALPRTNPALAALFARAKHRAEAQSRFVRASGRFPLTAVGDVNTYALFAECARTLVNQRGRAGIIVPTGIATDDSTKAFFGNLSQQRELVSLFDFENREAIFPGVHRSYKFCALTLGATTQPTRFSFFATDVSHLQDSRRVFELTAEDIALLNPNTRTCPVFRTRADAELTKKIYRRVPVLVNEHAPRRHGDTENQKESPRLRDSVVNNSGNPWGVRFMTMFHMSNDSHLFHTAPGADRLPLYEAKLLHQFTHRWATYEHGAVRELTPEELADPTCTITPRYWVDRAEVEARLAERWQRGWLLGFRRITNTTNERTGLFAILPAVAAGDSVFLMLSQHSTRLNACLLATLNSLALDYVTRQKMGGVNLNFYIVNQLPVLPPTAFSAEDIAYIVPRVLELVYTAWDLRPFAEDVWAELDEAGRALVLARWKANHKDTKHTKETHDESSCPLCLCGEYDLSPFTWNEERRALIRAELDARIARLYGLSRDELRYILDPQEVMGEDFPGETFRVLKEKELRQWGEYRTRRLVLEAWDREDSFAPRRHEDTEEA